MKVLRVSNKKELLERVHDLDGGDADIYVSMRPTLDIVDAIKNKCPNVKKLLCPPSLYRQTSKRVFRSLGDAGISFESGGFKVGRPKKYSVDTVQQILRQRQDGKAAKAISEEMDIPLRTVYFYLRIGQ